VGYAGSFGHVTSGSSTRGTPNGSIVSELKILYRDEIDEHEHRNMASGEHASQASKIVIFKEYGYSNPNRSFNKLSIRDDRVGVSLSI
jgi:hypothetical protein